MLGRLFPWALLACIPTLVEGRPTSQKRQEGCRKTTVAILGGGVTGITAAQALANQSIDDFLIVEYHGEIGGRMKHTSFGKQADGQPYTIELGANWVQGLGGDGRPENPIWTFAKKYNVSTTYSNYSNILTYNETGETDYVDLINEYDEAYVEMEQHAGYIITENLQDMSARSGMALAGWKPGKDMKRLAVDWWLWDFESAHPPEEDSFVFGVASYNASFYQFNEDNELAVDPRGFNTLLKGIASEFLKPNDTRLLLNTVVTNITYSDTGVTITNSDDSCITADYAICTFSLGVLQNDAVAFSPELPDWKQEAIQTFQMGTYTKIFLQFNETFWDPDHEYFLYASPTTRGYYPIWQSLSTEGFLPGSNIIFVTVTGDESYRIEAQTDEETKAEALEVLREMFPNVTVPDPIAFTYPRWSLEPWAYGSYSNWPIGTTLERHQNLRANVERLYFAGEHTSPQYFGFLHGSWFEGREVGERIAGLLGKECLNRVGDAVYCGSHQRYEDLKGTTEEEEYEERNGWDVNTFIEPPPEEE